MNWVNRVCSSFAGMHFVNKIPLPGENLPGLKGFKNPFPCL